MVFTVKGELHGEKRIKTRENHAKQSKRAAMHKLRPLFDILSTLSSSTSPLDSNLTPHSPRSCLASAAQHWISNH